MDWLSLCASVLIVAGCAWQVRRRLQVAYWRGYSAGSQEAHQAERETQTVER